MDKADCIERLNKTIEKVKEGQLVELVIVEHPLDGDTVVAYTCSQMDCQALLDRAKIAVGVKTVMGIKDIVYYQEKMKKVKQDGFKSVDYKALGSELQNRFQLTVPQVTAILNNRTEEILELLKERENI